jgi:hypothetical protein
MIRECSEIPRRLSDGGHPQDAITAAFRESSIVLDQLDSGNCRVKLEYSWGASESPPLSNIRNQRNDGECQLLSEQSAFCREGLAQPGWRAAVKTNHKFMARLILAMNDICPDFYSFFAGSDFEFFLVEAAFALVESASASDFAADDFSADGFSLSLRSVSSSFR